MCIPDFVYKRGGGSFGSPTHPKKKILTRNLAEEKSNLNKRPFVGPTQTPPPLCINSLKTKSGAYLGVQCTRDALAPQHFMLSNILWQPPVRIHITEIHFATLFQNGRSTCKAKQRLKEQKRSCGKERTSMRQPRRVVLHAVRSHAVPRHAASHTVPRRAPSHAIMPPHMQCPIVQHDTECPNAKTRHD